MITWLRGIARAFAFRFPIILKSLHIIGMKGKKIREYKNVNNLLSELHSDTALQLPLLVEQNRKMFREIESLKLEVESLKNQVAAGKK